MFERNTLSRCSYPQLGPMSFVCNDHHHKYSPVGPERSHTYGYTRFHSLVALRWPTYNQSYVFDVQDHARQYAGADLISPQPTEK